MVNAGHNISSVLILSLLVLLLPTMACNKLIRVTFPKFSTRKFHDTTERSSNWRDLMKKELENGKSLIRREESSDDPVCIYRVPSNMRQVEPKAYRPNNISIGPFHKGAPHLHKMELLKKNLYCRLFNVNGSNKLDEAFKFLEEQEVNARRCYNDEIKLSSDEFLQMMLIDGSFVIQLLRDLSACDQFGSQQKQFPNYLSRWMLPIMRRELIMLENQLPLFVLNKLFDLTTSQSQPCSTSSLKALALRFFYPSLQVDSFFFVEVTFIEH